MNIGDQLIPETVISSDCVHHVTMAPWDHTHSLRCDLSKSGHEIMISLAENSPLSLCSVNAYGGPKGMFCTGREDLVHDNF